MCGEIQAMAKFRRAVGTLAVPALTSPEAKLLLAALNLCYRLQKKKKKKEKTYRVSARF